MKSNESQREMRKKEKLERELKMNKAEVESKNAELKAKQSQLQKAQEETSRLEQQLKEQRVCKSFDIISLLLIEASTRNL